MGGKIENQIVERKGTEPRGMKRKEVEERK